MKNDIKRAVIFASRPVTAGMRRYLREDDYIITADAGWKNALALGVAVDLAVGDFDSGQPPQNAGELLRLPPEKDDTDTHYAAKMAVERGCGAALLLGGLGARLDHSLANLHTLLFLRRSGLAAAMAAEDVEVHCVAAGEALCLEKGDWPWLSVFAAGGAARGVCLTGVKYPLDNAVLMPDFPLGTSNEFAAEMAGISCTEGYLYVVLARGR